MEIHNRKAHYNFEFIEYHTTGIVLTGTEIKSIRQGHVNINDAFCYIDLNDEVWMKNSFIAKYENGSHYNHNENRERKLLLTKKEIRSLKKDVETPGITLIPTKLFIDENGLCKIVLVLAKGKKTFDKRETIKRREAEREMQSATKRMLQ